MIPGILTTALNQIISHPETWNQGDWFCGTTACLAGHVCLEAGAVPLQHTDPDTRDVGLVTYEGSTLTAPHLAEHLCGLTWWEGQWLWSADRTMPDLYEAVNRIERDLALYCWRPGNDEHIGPAWSDEHRNTTLVLHRATTAEYTAGGWHRKDHPSRATARIWATTLAHRHGLAPVPPSNLEVHPA